MCFLHVGHEKSDELVDAAGGLEDASVVGQLLQHLEALKYRATQHRRHSFRERQYSHEPASVNYYIYINKDLV